jgi:hypothetical protein
MESNVLVFTHDSDVFDYIGQFQQALRKFGLYIEDVTDSNSETIYIVISDTKPEIEWDE